MQLVLFRRRARTILLIGLTVALSVLLLMLLTSGAGVAQAQAKHSKKAHIHKSKKGAKAHKASDPVTEPGESATTESTETETGPGEPAGGHEDPPGDVNHEFSGVE
jgi:hypothetical protein